jgi:hypothetical protein
MECQVHGGDEPPCIPEVNMTAELLATGFPCPYREPATPDDNILIRLVSLACQPHIGHLYRSAFDVAFEDRSPHQRRHRLEMLLSALADERITRQISKLRAQDEPPKEEKPN